MIIGQVKTGTELRICADVRRSNQAGLVEIVVHGAIKICELGRDCLTSCPFSFESMTRKAKVAELLMDDGC